MSALFDDLGRLDLDAHVRRWSAPEAGRAEGAVSQWMAAAQQFAARVQEDPGGVPDARWPAIAQAWSALLAAAERATGAQHNEWLLRDLWLGAWLLQRLGPRADVPFLDAATVLDRALDAMPLNPREAAVLAPRWRELDRTQILALRMIRRLLAPVRPLAPLLAEHPRHDEYEAWERLAGDLP
ncbi:hypothetical protein [Streptomyces resistomycificus]|uniref:Uncharacterized protein n=1 Tax=Streptomyces resistomycificus TaxID=67356 RepID=A0A0L8L8G8_9ACTN|nr:hypothetical protein [Streptomyces resistomycificus]KOG34366.1 hypothetical protein ADK37_19025 [Streptomyces resistomycificus]KUN98845.1 hypothetical protein AQJ84_14450 [Streptomyces resistomycificus]